MRITESNLSDEVKDVYVSEYGNFYFLEGGIVISEINEGVTYTWEEAIDVIDAALDFYGQKKGFCYISNRVNNYSIKPSDWTKFYEHYELNSYAVVTTNENSWFNALMEKSFLKVEIQRFEDLYEAIKWAKKNNLNNQNSNLAC